MEEYQRLRKPVFYSLVVRFITLHSVKLYSKAVGKELEEGGRVLQASVQTQGKTQTG
jgi:hypothetical protein